MPSHGLSLPLFMAFAILSLTMSPTYATPGTLLDYSEAAALLKLRSDLGIRSHYWPREADPCLSWAGITCNEGHVVSIYLTGLRRTVKRSQQPFFGLDALQQFPFLKSINASGFPLPGSLPPWLGSLLELEYIDFSSTELQGPIVPTIGMLSHLQVLVLAKNKLTGSIPANIFGLSYLKVLDLSSNKLTGQLPSNVAQLQSLRILKLSSNNLRGSIPAEIGDVTALQVLDLANNQFFGSIPSQVGNLSELTTLDLSFNSLSGSIPPELGKLLSMNTLIISHNALSGPIPEELTHCERLAILLAEKNELNGKLPTSFVFLQKLSILNLSFNHLTGMLPKQMGILSYITKISVSHNSFYGPLPVITNVILNADWSDNYLSGNLSEFPFKDEVIRTNCFSGVTNQRSMGLCMAFYLKKGIAFQGTAVPLSSINNQHLASETGSRKVDAMEALLLGVFGGLGVVTIMIFVALLLSKNVTKRNIISLPKSDSDKLDIRTIAAITSLYSGEKLPFTQLKDATGGFSPSNLIKCGHSGELYKGLLSGVPIVVKKVLMDDSKKAPFITEMNLFKKLSHSRLVPILGYCLELEKYKFVVYKYMSNGDLAHALKQKDRVKYHDPLFSLDWITRLKIAVGTAEALVYLHHECSPPIVHRDVQASSILLDHQFEVRLGSLSGAVASEGESHHGVVARLFHTSPDSDHTDVGTPPAVCSYDVYCFGKVLLQLITGKGEAGGTLPDSSLLEWALPLVSIYSKESIGNIVDPSLILDEDLLNEVWAVAIVAKSCLNPKPSKRPLMRHVLKALQNPLKFVSDDRLERSTQSRHSSYGSWSNTVFNGWYHGLSEAAILSGSVKDESLSKSSSKKQSDDGVTQGTLQAEAPRRRHWSSEIFPDPSDPWM